MRLPFTEILTYAVNSVIRVSVIQLDWVEVIQFARYEDRHAVLKNNAARNYVVASYLVAE